ncbi:exonuclease SbcCD subunit D C-terminal domain-containing protein [Wohlfahrtiimonas larvae]|uniref:Nuclease SbcCD subunit D n=1 Tax=Wohlfahrtiimonas larvae TaxID=1157986 RepID=A0ABP9MFL3_9GAMM|nr:exonuclease SbcCD subunit D C-terminal domain-containing protein [Wohlfahrtiimonas larvae]
MRILHTADWHLGRALYHKKRYAEFEAFLNWLADAITEHAVDALLIAGDVFDTSTPSNRAQSLYYEFLHRVAKGSCRHIVIIGGNHDSPSFLNAPKALLHTLNVHVVGAMPDDLQEEVITLYHNDQPEAIICAVPYLRDKDIRLLEAGENIDDKNAKLIEGIRNHYADVCVIAEAQQKDYENAGFKDIPIIGMGHLFTAGAQTVDGDGVRELYVGTLAHVGRDLFPASLDYLALGHLHVPQKVGGAEHIRYSGSPIPMGYGEINQDKQVLLVDFVERSLTVTPLLVPRFQQLVRITGDVKNIQQKIEQLKAENSNAWLEIEYTGTEIVSNLRDLLDEALKNSDLEVLRIKNRRLMERVIHSEIDEEILDDLNPDEVFARCLTAFEVDEAEKAELRAAYQEIIQELQDHDKNAE